MSTINGTSVMKSTNGYLLPLIAGLLMLFSAMGQSLLMEKPRLAQDRMKPLIQSLIHFSHSYSEQDFSRFKGLYGFLPSPSRFNRFRDGSERLGSVNQWVIGQLPWYTLGIPQPFSDAGECFVYVVAGPAQKNTAYINALYNPDFTQPLHYRGQQGVAALFPLEALEGIEVNAAKDWHELCRSLDLEMLMSPPDSVSQIWDLSHLYPLHLIGIHTLFQSLYQRRDFQRDTESFANAYLQCLALHASIHTPPTYNIYPAHPSRANHHRLSAYQSDNSLDALSVQLGRLPLLDGAGNDLGNLCTALVVESGRERRFVDLSRKRSLTLHSSERKFWTHWKDHWFYAVAPQCISQGICIQHQQHSVIAMVIFANEAQSTQNRKLETFDQWLESPLLGLSNGLLSSITTNDLAWCLNTGFDIYACHP